MDFLHPGFLWALPVLALPLALHLWGRLRSVPTPFSAVDLLREAARDQRWGEQFRRYALLAVRTLLLAALVYFFSRPGVSGTLGGGSAKGLLLLDASYSLQCLDGGETGFDRARILAQGLLRDRRPQDQWGVVVFSDRVEHRVSPTSNLPEALSVLESAKPSYRGTRLEAGLVEAARLLPEGGSVVLLSDLAAHGMGETISAMPAGVRWVAVEVIGEQPNAAVLRTVPGTPGPKPILEIRGWGRGAPRPWTLRGDGRLVGKGSILWEAGLTRVGLPAGSGKLEFTLSADALPADDRFFAIGQDAPRTSLLVVNGAPSLSPVGDETYFLRPVLERLALEGVRVETVSAGELSTRNLSEFSVVALLNLPPLPAESGQGLARFVERGGGLWVTAGDRGGAGRLEDLLPLSALVPFTDRGGLGWTDPGWAKDLADFDWAQVRVDQGLTGVPRPGSQVLLSHRFTQQPLLTVLTVGRGRVAFWGSSIDRDWTNLPTKPAFPVLTRELLTWLTGPGTQVPLDVRVGDALGGDARGNQAVRVVRPDGIAGIARRQGRRWEYDQTDLPGFYEIQGSTALRVAVNVAAEREGDLRRVTRAAFQSKVGGAPVEWIPADRATLSHVRRALRGRDLTPWLAAALGGLFLLETLLLWPRRRVR